MKKLFAFILILCMTVSTFALTSCDTTQTPSDTAGETETKENTEAPTSDSTDKTTEADETDPEEAKSETEANVTTDGNTNETDDETEAYVDESSVGNDNLSTENGGSTTENFENVTSDNNSDSNNNEDVTSGNNSETSDNESDTAADEGQTDAGTEPVKEESTYLGKTPAQLYTEALAKLKATSYTVASDALMTSTNGNYRSTRRINAKISANALFANIIIDYDTPDSSTEEKTWILDGKMYQLTTSGAKTLDTVSDSEAASMIASFPMNYMVIMFDYTDEHFGDAKFAVAGEFATVKLELSKEHLSALTGEDSYAEAKASECKVEIVFDKNGNISKYSFDWTITRTINGTDTTEAMKYDITFTDIGTTTVTAPEDAESYKPAGESSSSSNGTTSDSDSTKNPGNDEQIGGDTNNSEQIEENTANTDQSGEDAYDPEQGDETITPEQSSSSEYES